MKTLTEFIYEELDTATWKRTSAQRLKNKKTELLAIKKGLASLSNNDDDKLKELAETVYSGISEYKTEEDMLNALNSGDVNGWKDMYDAVVKANSSHRVDADKIIDVVEKIAAGMKLDVAIAQIAKKL